MPRVNRDLQRRMAARRERERRRPPPERRYRFAAPEPELAPDELNQDQDQDLTSEQGTAEAAVDEPISAPATRRRTDRSEATPVAATPRSGARASHRPFTEYRAEYDYVLKDLRRIAVVIGSLLLVLILLYFVLPH